MMEENMIKETITEEQTRVEKTQKLYEQDSHCSCFTAKVLSCQWEEKKKLYGVVLDRTAFFPEGGGQYADPGILGGIQVEDVREREGRVVHYMKKPLEPGTQVEGAIDWRERFSRMQQHSGEHIVSGLVHQKFGYDNVGFHLGQELVTMDFNGVLTPDDLREIEYQANQAAVANIEVEVSYPTKEELEQLEYRSKKELAGQVRIVTIPGYDCCACCAPHVTRTGEIGMIRLIDAVRYKGGTRVSMVCGFRALDDFLVKEDNIREISRSLSAKPYETAQAVRHLQEELQGYREQLLCMQSEQMRRRLEEISPESRLELIFEKTLDKNIARRFVDEGMQRFHGICGIFLGSDETGYQYTLGSTSVDMKEFLKEFHQHFAGKGGGKSQMVQGTVRPAEHGENLQEALEAYLGKALEL